MTNTIPLVLSHFKTSYQGMEASVLCLCFLFLFRTCSARTQHVGQILPGFKTTQMDWVEKDGLFLLSNKSTFGFGFYTSLDIQFFVLVVIHLKSEKVVWTANRGLLVSNSDKFVFENDGNVYMQRGNGFAWSSDTGGKGVASMELMDSGNLVLLGDEGNVVWQSFDHPTDTLLPGQEFVEGMKLKSFRNKNDLYNYLEFQSGDLVLYAGFDRPQTYWSLSNDSRKTNSSVRGRVHSASLVSNSWSFYSQDKILLWRFVFSDHSDLNATWAIMLGSDGKIGFYNLQNGRSVSLEAFKIPQDPCGVPEPCDPYYVCYFDNWCQCPSQLNSQFGCKPEVVPTCNSSRKEVDLFHVGERLNYFALGFVVPSLKSNLNACREACLKNCSCTVLFFEESSGNCFLFDQMGSFTRAPVGSAGYVSYLKVSKGELTSAKITSQMNEGVMVAVIIVATLVVIAGLIYLGLRYHQKKVASKLLQEHSEDDFESFTGMPVRYTYNDLCKATKDFTMKIGQGGFGSVYTGILPDGSRLAVKKLEGVGQGKKEFRAEVNIIGSIHHVHLVKLKGFCAEGTHRLLVYEYMGNGSLDKWIFKNNEESVMLDWNTRFNIALGTAKGLAYLHEECEVKIVHCDIKPENVLLDDNFTAKVSDFGLAKLMNRDDSHVYTTVRGTRGYLAPEWITNNPISEKSDVYSYGIVLLEIIRGRRNFNSAETSAQSSLPSFSFKMLEEGKLKQIIDPKLIIDEHDEAVINTIKVALWCIQDEMQLRPPMAKVVQMLEGLCPVPDPPVSSPGARSYVSIMKWNDKESSSGGLVGYDSEAFQSDIRLSGPR